MHLRPYQIACDAAIDAYWRGGGGNPLVVMATGLGKSVIFAEKVRGIVERYPAMRICMLVHVRELVEQNYRTLKAIWPHGSIGIYSAGLGRKDAHNRVICANIQSIYEKTREVGAFDLLVIDEAHLVPKSDGGMYRKFIQDQRERTPDLRVLGLTATPFRLDSGRLDRGDDRLFDQVVYDYGIRQGIEDGWLAPITAKAGGVQIDVSGVAKRGGEFVPGALEKAAMDDDLIAAACNAMLERAGDRNSWLVFCAGVKHAYAVRDALRAINIHAETITGETDKGERSRLVSEFKAGRIRALTNANVLTTGFDAPGVDMIAFLRPTLSTSLYVQMTGRGTRPIYEPGFNPNAATAEDRKASIARGPKPDCLILDFAGNVMRHGPVDMVEPADKSAKKGEEGRVGVNEVQSKECEECGALNYIQARVCQFCGHEFPQKNKHADKPDEDVAIISTEISRAGVRVDQWGAVRHMKAGSPDSVCVTYYAGMSTHREWVCFQHEGVPHRKAHDWWKNHGGSMPVPETVTDALTRWHEVTQPSEIFVEPQGKWWRIVGRRWKDEDIRKMRGFA
jgi:DNA repair protein RadD